MHVRPACCQRNTHVRLALAIGLAVASAIYANDPGTVDGATITFQGNQASGIAVQAPPSPGTVQVNTLTGKIEPAAGTCGISLLSSGGTNLTLETGTAAASNPATSIGITTSAANGIKVSCTGVSSSIATDAFLNIPIPGTPGVSGGEVTITSRSDIATSQNSAHGIVALSSTPGYPDAVFTTLQNFSSTGFSFTVDSVSDPDASVFIAPGTAVNGQALVKEGDEKKLGAKAGMFTVAANGTFEFSMDGDFDGLADGESKEVVVYYKLNGTNPVGTARNGIEADLHAVVQRDAKTHQLAVVQLYAVFDGLGMHNFALNETSPHAVPDLDGFVDSLLASAFGAGGSGDSVTVKHIAGTIGTSGMASHGIWAESIGAAGAPGANGGGFWTFGAVEPSGGGGGKNSGAVNVQADGVIETVYGKSDGTPANTAEQASIGVFARSTGGNGGAGGDGGCWYWGRPGGVGGTAGNVDVKGSATINTWSDFGVGILALSDGGDGGIGGEGHGAMGADDGGAGGLGGEVRVEGDWDITTQGDDAHGIWAKSLGGNAGPGGSGGWMGGDNGTGGVGADGDKVTISSEGKVETWGVLSYGLFAQSVGGFGGSGGGGTGIFWCRGGDGNSAGSGGEVDVTNKTGGWVETHNNGAHAVYAQSIGGGGGAGGYGVAIASLGGTGGAGGDGGVVHVINDGTIKTHGETAYGIFAESVGGTGGEGGFGAGIVGIGGKASGVSIGKDVTVDNHGTVTTDGKGSHAVFVQSVGGGGGAGGGSMGWVSIGGDGTGGGKAGKVTVTNTGALIQTTEPYSTGIYAQSVGGGGGNGGDSGSIGAGASFAIGGNGEKGGNGDNVSVTSTGTNILTEGTRSMGIYAQSVGGGGGDGGFAMSVAAGSGVSLAIGIGGKGGKGGDAGDVLVDNSSHIKTTGEKAEGIFAESVGGGGGDGGGSIAVSASDGVAGSFSIGGNGDSGGNGGTVSIKNDSFIETTGVKAIGLRAQSVGGGGGNGGFAIASGAAGNLSLNVGFAGTGGGGGSAMRVDVNNSGSITTNKETAHAIFAQSIGGGGGNGGFAITSGLSTGASLGVSIGGKGGAGGAGKEVDVFNSGTLHTSGTDSYGVWAQSIGGGGGNGGFSVSGGLTGVCSLNIGVGGAGGGGGNSERVILSNSGSITTEGSSSHAIFAQSIGGGGGNGGMSITAGATLADKSVNASVSVGGKGGKGGAGGNVYVGYKLPTPADTDPEKDATSGELTTSGSEAHGIFAQSIGGGGGTGGSSLATTFTNDAGKGTSVTATLTFGGAGGQGNVGRNVFVESSSTIVTSGSRANGIYAQSIGGGGGSGGSAQAINLTTSGLVPFKSFEGSNYSIALNVGGNSGAGNLGGEVTVTNHGAITTNGILSRGISAQSIGGGGGSVAEGILGAAGDWVDGAQNVLSALGTAKAISDSFKEKSVGGLMPNSLTVTLGGNGGDNGNAKAVRVDNAGSIVTSGMGSHAIFAQSIGGGGGEAQAYAEGTGAGEDVGVGVGLLGEFAIGGKGGAAGSGAAVTIVNSGRIEVWGTGADGIYAQSIGGGGGQAGSVSGGFSDLSSVGLGVGFQRSGGCGGNGDVVTVTNTGSIVTHGASGIGIFAQSIGGGGGILGDVGGIAFAGSVGGFGSSGLVSVTQTGDILTTGAAAHGIFAQSCGGFTGTTTNNVELDPVKHPEALTEFKSSFAGWGGTVGVTLNGRIDTGGDGAIGILTQSGGNAGAGNITVTIEAGSVTGGSGAGSGVCFVDGATNLLTNKGAISARSGLAVRGGTGGETIDNLGTIVGNIDLGTGANTFNNKSGGVLDAGSSVALGSGNLLTNEGTLSPAGEGVIGTTRLVGNLRQTDTGTSLVNLDQVTDTADRIEVAGNAALAGTVRFVHLQADRIVPGTRELVFLTTTGTLDTSGLAVANPPSVVVDYALVRPAASYAYSAQAAGALPAANQSALGLSYTIDFDPAGLDPHLDPVGQYINRVQLAGSSPALSDTILALIALPDLPTYSAALAQFAPDFYGEQQASLIRGFRSFGTTLLAHDGGGARSVWFQEEATSASHGDTGYWGRTTSTTNIQTLGGQKVFGDWAVGAGFGLEHGRLKGASGSWRATSQAQFAGLSLQRRWAGTTVATALTYGWNRTSTRRESTITEPLSAQCRRRLQIAGAALHADHDFRWMAGRVDEIHLRPSLDCGLLELRSTATRESGADARSLLLPARRETIGWCAPRLDLGLDHPCRNGLHLRPYVGFGLRYYLGAKETIVRASLAEAPDGVAGMVAPVDLANGSTLAEIGLDVLGAKSVSLRVGYRRESGHQLRSDSGFIKATFSF